MAATATHGDSLWWEGQEELSYTRAELGGTLRLAQ